ncbi:MFS transporter [Burkholderia sp. L27(2015)]|uniref:MFS transporter n=1 Tax=Burkholderia sp. L27(2015) TaxID=1641858 RepID=UPI001C20840C|nr:MFS transporter [Burkholderia sp. L27(2015)]
MDTHAQAYAPAAQTLTESQVLRKIAWRLIPLIIICYLFAYFDRINISFAKFQIQSDLGFSDTVYGLGASIFFIGYVLFEVPSNLLLHKFGARKWIARIMVTWGIATAAMMFVHSVGAFYLLRFLIGALEAGFAPGVLYYFTQWFPASFRGRIHGLFFLSIAFAGVLGAPASGLILAHMDGVAGISAWHWLFLAGGLPCVLLGIVVFFYLEDNVRDARWLNDQEKAMIVRQLDNDTRHIASHTLLSAFKSPALLALALVYLLVQIGSYGLNFWMPHLIKMSGATNPVHIGLITAIPYLAAAIGMVVVGRLSDRTGERRAFLGGLMLLAGAGFVGAGIFEHSTVALVVSLTAAGAGVMVSIPMFWTLPARFLTGAGAAGGIALVNSLGQLGGVISPYMVGKIHDVTGSTTPAVYAIGVLCVICAAIVFFALPKTLRGRDRVSD